MPTELNTDQLIKHEQVIENPELDPRTSSTFQFEETLNPPPKNEGTEASKFSEVSPPSVCNSVQKQIQSVAPQVVQEPLFEV